MTLPAWTAQSSTSATASKFDLTSPKRKRGKFVPLRRKSRHSGCRPHYHRGELKLARRASEGKVRRTGKKPALLLPPALPSLARRASVFAPEHPFVRLADLPQRLSCTYHTAKSDITRLIAAGILSEVPNVRPKTYFAPAVYEIAYERLTEQDS